jgi:integrase
MLNELVFKAERQQAGISDPFEKHKKDPVSKHVADFRRHLESKNNSSGYVETTVSRVKKIFEGCKFRYLPDILASRVAEWLADRRQEGMNVASSNHYLTATKNFTRWLIKDRRNGYDPLSHLSRLNGEADIRRRRRTLSDEEFTRLLKAARTGKVACGLDGISREMVYLFCSYTGLRASETASLTPQSLNLHSEPATVTVEAGYSKHKREDILPLHSDIAQALQDWIDERQISRTEKIWPGTWAKNRHGAEMLREDLQTARAAWIKKAGTEDEREEREQSDFLKNMDDSGKVFDFHSLRHQFKSMLAKSNVHPKTAQELARHSDINLTMKVYTHVRLNDLGAAVESLPGQPGKNSEPLRKIGTCYDTPVQKTQTPERAGGFGIVAR